MVNSEPLAVTLTHPTLLAGSPFTFSPDTPPGWYDQGDGSGPRSHPGEGSFYTQPGDYTLTFYAEDGREVKLPLSVGGAPAFTTNRKCVVLSTNDLRRLGFGGTDNGVGCARAVDGDRLYFLADVESDDNWKTWESNFVRLRVAEGGPLTAGTVTTARVQNSPFRSPDYLDAGPVVRYGERLWMLALSGKNLPGTEGFHGGLELCYSDDEGLTWSYAGTALAQPFTFEDHGDYFRAKGRTNDAANMATGMLLIADADGDGRDYLYAYFHQAESGGILNSLAVARANVAELTAAVAQKEPVAPLWRKRRGGAFVGPHDGLADVLLSCGGWPSVIWCVPLRRYLLFTAAPPSGLGSTLFYLSSSQDGLTWSAPALIYAEQRVGWFAGALTFDAPDGYVGSEFDVFSGPCWHGSLDGSKVDSAHEVHGVRVAMA